MENPPINNDKFCAKGKIKAYVTESILTSTTHGIDRIIRTNRVSLKIIWLTFFAASTAACGYFIARNIIDYLKYEVVTKIEVIYEVPQLFPTVSVCNANILSTNSSVEFSKHVFDSLDVSNPFSNTAQFIGFNMTPAQISLLMKYVVISNFQSPNITKADLKQYGVTYEDFFLSCTFNLKACDTSIFEWYFDIKFGSCFRFNYQGMSPGPLYSYRPSDFNGLRVELYIPDITDVYSFSSDTGAYVIINNASVTSNSLVGVRAEVGAQTNIQVSREFIHKLESPYSECIQDLASYGSDFYEVFVELGITYRQSDCYELCYQNYLLKTCGCMDSTAFPFPDQPYCMNIEQFICNFKEYLIFFGTGSIDKECGKQCPLECDSEIFELTISSSSYPTKAYADQLVNYSGNTLANFFPNVSAVTYKDLKEHILAINIYYADMKYTSIEELEKTNLFDLVAAIGGTLGLFLGMSFLSFVEIVDVIIEIVFIFIQNQRRINKVSFFKKTVDNY